jgi:hypothetical protein
LKKVVKLIYITRSLIDEDKRTKSYPVNCRREGRLKIESALKPSLYFKINEKLQSNDYYEICSVPLLASDRIDPEEIFFRIYAVSYISIHASFRLSVCKKFYLTIFVVYILESNALLLFF